MHKTNVVEMPLLSQETTQTYKLESKGMLHAILAKDPVGTFVGLSRLRDPPLTDPVVPAIAAVRFPPGKTP